MRLIYADGRRVGPDPKGHYVYLWRDDADRYVGRGVNGRWAAHLKFGAQSSNQIKGKYFVDNAAKLSCYILAEGLPDEGASATIEMDEIVRRRAGGTLLNDKNGSAFYGRAAPGKRTTPHTPQYQVVLDSRKKGHITPNALLRRAGRALNGNPKKAGSGGARYIDLYPPAGQVITVGDMYARGRAEGFTDGNNRGNQVWDWDHGFIEIWLPEGESVLPGYFLPARL
jgi:hypothetical protein